MTENGHKTIMIIDDNPVDLYVASRVIHKLDPDTGLLQYSSAGKALDFLQEKHADPSAWPDVLLVDIYMPGMSGFEFMDRYAGFDPNLRSKSRVYIVSSSIDERDINRANHDPNVTAFREKPLTVEFLQGAIA